jgi:hypothetical protein
VKYPVFVIEGPDNSGKTTLCKQLVAKTNAVYLHATYKFKGRMMLYHIALMRQAIKIAETRPVVLDRWFQSELVYGNVYRNGPEPEYHPNWMGLQYFARKLGFSMTFCCPMRFEEYIEGCRQSYHNREQMFKFDEAKLNHCWRIYRDLWHDTYHVYDRELLQVFSLPQDRWKGEKFADYILSQKKSWNQQASPEVKQFIREFTYERVSMETVVEAARMVKNAGMDSADWNRIQPVVQQPVQHNFF